MDFFSSLFQKNVLCVNIETTETTSVPIAIQLRTQAIHIMTTTRILPTGKIVKRSTTFLKPRSEKEKRPPLSSSFDSNPLTLLFNELSFSNQRSTFTNYKQKSLHHSLKSKKRSFCLSSLDETNAKRSGPSSPKSVMKPSPLDQVEDYGYFADYDLKDATTTFSSSSKVDAF
jgi:hypothetical protein